MKRTNCCYIGISLASSIVELFKPQVPVEMVKDIKISEFDYPLPEEKIAKYPLKNRDECKLLVSKKNGECLGTVFQKLPDLLSPGSLLICNDTKVINARIQFKKETGSTIEVFLLDPISPKDYALIFQSRKSCRWSCMVGNLKRWKEGPLTKKLNINGKNVSLTAKRLNSLEGNSHEIDFSWDDESVTFASVIEVAGFIPIPPYLNRKSEASDREDYQTVYAEFSGSVAAPTAGLHFTPKLFNAISDKGIDIRKVTLHVGAGTFQPVKSEQIGEHPMHTESFCISKDLLIDLLDALNSGRKITAVGTTSVRTLESIPYLGFHLLAGNEDLNVTQWEAYEFEQSLEDQAAEGESATKRALEALVDYLNVNNVNQIDASTSIMIAPGFKWRIVDAMVTNFHQPQSTLLLLVSSFLGNDENGNPRWKELYDKALKDDYRFLSYGDACYFEHRK